MLYYLPRMTQKELIDKEWEDYEEIDWDEELESRVRKLAINTIKYYEDYIYPEAYEIIKMKVLFNWDIKAILQATWNDHRSCNIYPLIASTHDVFYSNTFDLIPQMRVVAQNPEDIEKTQMAQDFIDRWWSAGESQYALEELLNEATLLGSSTGQVSFSKEEDDITYRVDWFNKEVHTEKLVPTVEHVPFFEFFVDPSANDFYKARWKFRRKIKSWDSISKTYASFCEDLDSKKKAILLSKSYVSNYDYNKIWEIKWYEGQYTKAIIKNLWTAAYAWSPDMITYQNLFQIAYEDNDLVEVIEYWDKNWVVIMMNWISVYDWPSLYPMTADPFVHLYYEKLPWSIRCRWIGHKLMSHQKQVNSHWNAVQDAINMHLRPMYLVEKWVIVWHDWRPPQKITWKDGQTLVSNQPWIQNWGLRAIEFLDFNMIQISRDFIRQLLNESQEIIGTNSYTQGWQGKVERVPVAARAKMQIVNSRLQQLISSMNRLQKKTFEMWLIMSSTFKWEKFWVRVLNKDSVTEEVKHTQIVPSDIINKFDVLVENSNDRLATKQERMGQVIQVLNILMPYIQDQATGTMRIDPADIIKQVLNDLEFKWIELEDLEWMKEQITERVELMKHQESLMWPVPTDWALPPEIAPTEQPQIDRIPWESSDDYANRSGNTNFDFTLQ